MNLAHLSQSFKRGVRRRGKVIKRHQREGRKKKRAFERGKERENVPDRYNYGASAGCFRARACEHRASTEHVPAQHKPSLRGRSAPQGFAGQPQELGQDPSTGDPWVLSLQHPAKLDDFFDLALDLQPAVATSSPPLVSLQGFDGKSEFWLWKSPRELGLLLPGLSEERNDVGQCRGRSKAPGPGANPTGAGAARQGGLEGCTCPSGFKSIKLNREKKMQLDGRKGRELITNKLLPFFLANETSIWSLSRGQAASWARFLARRPAPSLRCSSVRPPSPSLSPWAFNYIHLFPLTRSVTLQQDCCNYAVGSTAHFAAA